MTLPDQVFELMDEAGRLHRKSLRQAPGSRMQRKFDGQRVQRVNAAAGLAERAGWSRQQFADWIVEHYDVRGRRLPGAH